MANRATDADVRAIRPSTAIADYDPYITAANIMVNEVAVSCGSGYDSARLAQIEIYLTAHLVGLADPLVSEEKFENASKKFEKGSQGGTGIMSTQYGQTANMLSGGCLARLDMQPASVQFA